MKLSLRYLVRSAAWAVATLGLIGGTFVSLPYLAGLDRRGLPGSLFALLLVAALAGLSTWIVYRQIPSSRRGRDLSRAAVRRGLRFRARFRLPSSWRALPSLGSVGYSVTCLNLVSGWEGRRHLLVFDVRDEGGVGYEPVRWRTCAVGSVPFVCPRIVVQPRSFLDLREGPAGEAVDFMGLSEARFESAGFGQRYRVLAEEPMTATALLDQRLMEWLLGLPRERSFEVGGTWALCGEMQLLAPENLEDIVAVLDGFLGHIPHVVTSFYPRS